MYGKTANNILISVQKATFFDKYKNEISLAYTGGYVMITCSYPCKASDKFQLRRQEDNETVAEASCQEVIGVAIFRLGITESTAFGVYQCVVGNKISDDSRSWQYTYRVCKYLSILLL